MKRIALATAYLTVMSMLLFAQSPTPPAHSATEFAPLVNLPVYPGGPQTLETYLNSLDLYPIQAINAQLEGTVWVQFRVLSTGYLTEARVLRSQGPLLDKAALRAVAAMPRWYPAHRDGTPVSYLVNLPVTFRLD